MLGAARWQAQQLQTQHWQWVRLPCCAALTVPAGAGTHGRDGIPVILSLPDAISAMLSLPDGIPVILSLPDGIPAMLSLP